MSVFIGRVLTTGCPTTKFFSMLEMVPLVGKTTWNRGSPPGVEYTGELHTDGGLWVGRVGMED